MTHYRARYGDVGYAENVLYAGIPEALEALTSQGVVMGVCTSKKVEFAEKILVHFGLRHHFAFVDGGDVGISKVTQLAGLVAGGLDPATAVMIGDRDADLIAAHASGIASVGVLWGFGGRVELAAAGQLLEDPAELVGLV